MIFNNSFTIIKNLLKKYVEFWDVVKHDIKKINGGKETDCRKDYIKIKFESDDDLPINKPLIFHEMHIFVRFAFKENDKLYPEFFFRLNFMHKKWNLVKTKPLLK